MKAAASTESPQAPARFPQGEPVTILVSATAADEWQSCAPGGRANLMLGSRLPDGTFITVPVDYPGISVMRGDLRPVLIAMAKEAIISHRPRICCPACEPGRPCPGCVIDAQRRREFQEVLDLLEPPQT